MYWGRIIIVSKAGWYHAPPFKGFRGLAQGYPLLPTIFNITMDAVICHWVMTVAYEESQRSSGGRYKSWRCISTPPMA